MAAGPMVCITAVELSRLHRTMYKISPQKCQQKITSTITTLAMIAIAVDLPCRTLLFPKPPSQRPMPGGALTLLLTVTLMRWS